MNLELPVALAKVLVGLLILASSLWIGGFVALIIFSASSKKSLDRPQRIALFRQVGPRYLRVAAVASVLVVIPGAVLLIARPFDGFTIAVLVLAVAIGVVTWIGVRQARAMGRMRKAALAHPDDGTQAAAIDRAATRATLLRAGIGVLSLALFVVGIAMA
ncbi:hypothetical protein GCM10027052_06840 [Parafrigoribacterium mesophilum]|uniref:hypothetical protein n=1 Tax=Parafrigoribacterium mesophilum TaxID=433646 RepID=UPI0031FE24EA